MMSVAQCELHTEKTGGAVIQMNESSVVGLTAVQVIMMNNTSLSIQISANLTFLLPALRSVFQRRRTNHNSQKGAHFMQASCNCHTGTTELCTIKQEIKTKRGRFRLKDQHASRCIHLLPNTKWAYVQTPNARLFRAYEGHHQDLTLLRDSMSLNHQREE